MYSVFSVLGKEKENVMQMLCTVNQGNIKAQITEIILNLQFTEDMQNTDHMQKWSFIFQQIPEE